MGTTLRSLLIGTAIVIALVAVAILAVGVGHQLADVAKSLP